MCMKQCELQKGTAGPRFSIFRAHFLLVFFLALFLAGCTGEKLPSPTLRLGYLQSDIHHLPLFVALDRGFFQKEGVNVEVAGVFPSGPEEMSAFAAGSLDAGYVGIAPFINARANGKVQAVAVAQSNAEGSTIVVAAEGPVFSASGLKGKTVAVPGHGNVQDILLRRFLLDNGISLKEINTIVLKPPEMIGALQTGQIDGFVAWEPYPSKAVAGQTGRALARSGEFWPGHPCCMVVVQERLLREKPELVKALVRAHCRAIRFIREKPEESLQIGRKYTGMEPDVIQKAVANVKYDYYPDVFAVRDYVALINQLGFISVQDINQFTQDMFSLTFVDQVRQGGI